MLNMPMCLVFPSDLLGEASRGRPRPARPTIQVRPFGPIAMLWKSPFPASWGIASSCPTSGSQRKFKADSILNLTPELTGPSQTQNSVSSAKR